MCGITIYKGIETEISKLYNLMLELKHRGDEDGFGYLNMTNNELNKSILTFKEIEEEELNYEHSSKSKLATKEILIKRIKQIKENLKEKTNFIILHNRKASFGSISLNNTHPLQLNKNISYVHNGSVEKFELLKRYFEITFNIKFHSETDSEVLGIIVESLKSSGRTDKQIFEYLDDLCRYGFGVLVRINRLNKELTIFKDTYRSLYYYKLKDGMLLISEPTTTIKDFIKCYRIDSGFITIKEDIDLTNCKNKDVTNKLRDALKKEIQSVRCDSCNSDAPTLRMFDSKDFCLVCATGDKDVKELLKEKDSTDTKSTTETNIAYDNNKWATIRRMGYGSDYWDYMR